MNSSDCSGIVLAASSYPCTHFSDFFSSKNPIPVASSPHWLSFSSRDIHRRRHLFLTRSLLFLSVNQLQFSLRCRRPSQLNVPLFFLALQILVFYVFDVAEPPLPLSLLLRPRAAFSTLPTSFFLFVRWRVYTSNQTPYILNTEFFSNSPPLPTFIQFHYRYPSLKFVDFSATRIWSFAFQPPCPRWGIYFFSLLSLGRFFSWVLPTGLTSSPLFRRQQVTC